MITAMPLGSNLYFEHYGLSGLSSLFGLFGFRFRGIDYSDRKADDSDEKKTFRRIGADGHGKTRLGRMHCSTGIELVDFFVTANIHQQSFVLPYKTEYHSTIEGNTECLKSFKLAG